MSNELPKSQVDRSGPSDVAKGALAAMAALPALPIDALLPDIARALTPATAGGAAANALVIEAPPGAGKTTRVPRLLLELFSRPLGDRADGAAAGDIVVLEPRRLAAHLSAARVAEECGEPLGERVGVQMRFQSIVGPRTRLRFVTEGVLMRQLLADPTLRGVRAVVLDELHERHLATDLSLALLRRLQGGPRPDLLLLAMSATLHGAKVAEYLGGCPLLRSEGRTFPVEISYLPGEPDDPLWVRTRAALRSVLGAGTARPDEGDVLVFLPGAAEIRRCQDELAALAEERGLWVLPLHGDLPFDDQRRAVAATTMGPGGVRRRKVILATNVAETSLTIEGVTTVIDSGLARVAGHNPWSGLSTLRVQAICRAQATQRAGRAGRTGPGRCIRLYSRVDHDNRAEYEVPEIGRLDLAELLLSLAAMDAQAQALRFAGPLQFLDAPPATAMDSARRLLRRLGALDGDGGLTAIGARMSQLPLHPRLSRLVLAAAERGLLEEGATLAALLSERDLRAGRSSLAAAGRSGSTAMGRGAAQGADVMGQSDLLHLLDLQNEARTRRFDRAALQRAGIDADVAARVDRARRQIADQAARGGHATAVTRRPSSDEERDNALLQAVLCAYPDRVARRRGKSGPVASGEAIDLALSAGGAAVLSGGSVVRDSDLMVIVDVEDRGGGVGRGQQGAGLGGRPLVRLASAIQVDWLIDLPTTLPDASVHESEEVAWNAAGERVEIVRRLLYEQLVLDEDRRPARGDSEAEVALLAAQASAGGYAAFADGEALPGFLAKLSAVAQNCPELGVAVPTADQVATVARGLCQGRGALAELGGVSLIDALSGALLGASGGRSLRGELARLAPDSLQLPGGRRVRIHYETDKPPWVASRMQDFFGMREGPRIFGGRVPLVIQLLAPSQRPVQVTTDLAGFWTRHYPAIRRELCRRYPRHAWPEDPLQPAE